MNYLKQYEEIADSGNMELIERLIASFELQKRSNSGVLESQDEQILTMLINSRNWIRPASLFETIGNALNPE